MTQNSASTTPTTPPTITINGNNPAVIQVGDSYADLGATVTDSGPDQAEDTNLGSTTYVNGIEMSPLQIDTSEPATDTIDYVATDQNGLTATGKPRGNHCCHVSVENCNLEIGCCAGATAETDDSATLFPGAATSTPPMAPQAATSSGRSMHCYATGRPRSPNRGFFLFLPRIVPIEAATAATATSTQ